MKIRSITHWIGRRVLPILLLGVISTAIILFAAGVYTFSFLLDEEGNQLDGNLSQAGNPAADDSPVQNPTDTNTAEDPSSTETDDIVIKITPQTANSRKQLMALCDEMQLRLYNVPTLQTKGFVRSAGDYAAGETVLAYAGGFDFTPKVRSMYTGTRQVVEYVRETDKSAPVPVYSTERYVVPGVQVYMGYLLIDDGKTTTVYTPDGFYLLTYTTGKTIPAFTRDTEGRALFYQVDAAGNRTYYHLGEGELILSDYNDATDGRGLYFNYSPDFGLSDTNLYRAAKLVTTVTEHTDGTVSEEQGWQWAYIYNASRYKTGYRFSSAFDFSEGLAAVVDAEGKLSYILESGYNAFTTQKQYYYFQRYVIEYLLPPLTNGPESIGFYYYDHGLVRVRRQIIDYGGWTYYNELRVAQDEDILIDQAGKQFPIPEGYNIEAYSDGVILLSKDGKYGYMDHTGAWIAQPIYTYAEPFYEGLAVCGFSSTTRLMIDTEGNIVIPSGIYTHISAASNGVIAAWSTSDGWVIMHKMAKLG